MKKKLLLAMIVGAATITASAEGYKDGIEYYKAGQYENAITLLNRNLNDPSTDKALAYYYLGQSYLAEDNIDKAREYFNLGVSANPDCAYNYVGIGSLALRDKNKDIAKENFKKARSLAKKNAEVLVDIARAYYDADPVAFDKDITELIAKAHKDSKHKEPAIYIFEGDRKFRAKDYNGAATEYEQAITFDEDNPEGYVKYANTYFYVVPEYAIEKLQELLKRNPNSALAQRELAEKYYRNDQWSLAAKQYGEYINNPNHFPEDKARYSILLFAGENFEKALDIATEVLQSKPENVTLNRIVIRSLNALDRKAEALEKSQAFFSNTKMQASLNASDYSVHGQLLEAAKQDTAAFETFQTGLSKFPTDAELNYEVAEWYFDKRDYIPAAEYYGKFLDNTKNPRRNERFTGALYDYAAVLTANNQGDKETALKYAKHGVEIMDQAIEGLEDNTPHQYLHRRARLLVLANAGEPDEKAVADYLAEISILDKDPTLADPATKPNYLAEYCEAYQNLYKYYTAQGDTAKADEAKAKFDHYNTLRKQSN